MKNIDNINPFVSTSITTDFGILTTLVTAVEVSAKESCSSGEKSLLANYIYDEKGNYKLVYTLIDIKGNSESFAEQDGILPTLFLSPNQENFVSIVPYHPDKELEISIPVFYRENIELPKGNRPFVGNFIGTSNQFSIFFDADIWSETKPDKLLAIEFKNEVIKKKHNVKIPLPRNNKIFISNNEIHIVGKEGKGWLHRQIDETGKEIKRRHIILKNKYFREILSMSFDRDSYLLNEEKGKIIVEKISTNGQSEVITLIDLGDEFFATWKPVKISENTFVVHFTTEFGNGWLTIKNDKLLELFYSKDANGYRELLTNKVLETENNKLIISNINKTTEDSYAVVFYPSTDRKIKNKQLIILNRTL